MQYEFSFLSPSHHLRLERLPYGWFLTFASSLPLVSQKNQGDEKVIPSRKFDVEAEKQRLRELLDLDLLAQWPN